MNTGKSEERKHRKKGRGKKGEKKKKFLQRDSCPQ